MAHIIPELNLNKTPQLCKSNSLVYARNIKLQKDGSITKDDGLTQLEVPEYFKINFDPQDDTHGQLENVFGLIPYNTKLYIFTRYKVTPKTRPHYTVDMILEYDEDTKTFRRISCNWNYSGTESHPSTITGEVVIGLNGDIILNIAEKNDVVDVPFKTINVSRSTIDDDETIYTQTPNVPLYNLKQIGYYTNTIPAGTYQFFIRYEIWEDYYTDWFPCSRTCYAGLKRIKDLNIGRLSYIDEDRDSGSSFVFNVCKPEDFQNYNYKSFQIGFILSHDNDTVARSWKKFSLDTDVIYFDYNQNFIHNEDLKDFMAPTYGVYNVGNIASFKNRLYVTNYKETDFNPELANPNVELSVETAIPVDSYNLDGNEVVLSDDDYINTINGVTTGTIYNNQLPTFFTNLESAAVPLSVAVEELSVRIYGTSSTKYPTGCNASDKKYALNYDGIKIYADNIADLVSSIVAKANDNYFRINIHSGKTKCEEFTFYYKINNSDTTYQSVDFRIGIDLSKLNSPTTYYNLQTLLPHQQYKFYVHWVKRSGEITNGYLITDETHPNGVFEVSQPDDIDTRFIYYPKFTINSFPDGYVACFFSIQHYAVKVYEVFDINNNNYGHNMELDLGLIALNNEFNVIDSIGQQHTAKYLPSNSTEDLEYYGAEGVVIGDFSEDYYNFIKTDYINDSKEVELIKCTPYIYAGDPEDSIVFEDYNNEELLGFICEVFKVRNVGYFITTDGIYTKTATSVNGNTGLEFTELTEDEYKTHYSQPSSSKVYSSYNLNFISLTFEPTDALKVLGKTVQETGSGTVTTVTRETSVFPISIIPSTQISYVYKLSAMYHSILRKTYTKIDEAETIFNNTIRCSELVGDEAKVGIYRFKATDYYNVPTTKGIITNIKVIADQVLVHTEDSLFAFDGSNRITSSSGQVQVIESFIFDTGIREMLTSERGYAGLKKKKHSILTQYGYMFYDADANKIYLLGGEKGVQPISDSIYRVLNDINKIEDVDFAWDAINDRVLIHITIHEVPTSHHITLSYNFLAKGFISLHSYKFDGAVSTKNNAYVYITNANSWIDKIAYIDKMAEDYNTADSAFCFHDFLYPELEINNKSACIVDVVCNDAYEIIKTLQSISWINSAVVNFAPYITPQPSYLRMAEELNNKMYAGDYLRIYSDTCCTDKVAISDDSNKYSIATNNLGISPVEKNRPVIDAVHLNSASYTKPRYNKGYWSFNYFRNILNKEDEFAYGSPADNQSVIYGKYFVARFIFSFDVNFKLENVIFNYAKNL